MSDEPEEPIGNPKVARTRNNETMMGDYAEEPLEDPKVARARHRCLVLGILVVAALAIAAIVLPLTIKTCNCPKTTLSLPPSYTPPASSPVLPPVGTPTVGTPTVTPPAPNSPSVPSSLRTPAPTSSPAPSFQPTTARLGRFIEVYLVPKYGEAPFQDRNSPQFKTAEFIANVDTVAPNLASVGELGDRFGAVLFYYAMEGSSWLKCYQGDNSCQQAWLDPNVSVCDWTYIGCNTTTGRIVDIIFREYFRRRQA